MLGVLDIENFEDSVPVSSLPFFCCEASDDDGSEAVEMIVDLDSEPTIAPRKAAAVARNHVFGQTMRELEAYAPAFWARRCTRRRVLKQLAQECASFEDAVRRKAAEIRAESAKERLRLLRSGDLEAYASAVRTMKEGRLREILEETDRILSDLPEALSSVQLTRQPASLKGGTLMPHQLQGLRWLVALVDSRRSGILADDMGLGKTVQALSLVAFLADSRGDHGPHLFVVPCSLLSHWVDELSAWLPGLSGQALVLHGCRSQVQAVASYMARGDTFSIVFTTYEMVTLYLGLLSSFPWSCVVVDEGHRMKNSRTKFSQACRALPGRHRLLLTGTPVHNSVGDLWSLLTFVAPSALGSLDDFEQWFALPLPSLKRARRGDGAEPQPPSSAGAAAAGAAAAGRVLSEEEEILLLQRLHGVLRPFLLRRTKELVLRDLPPKREVVIWVPLSAWQSRIYKRCLAARDSEDHMRTMRRCQKALNHPYHFLAGSDLGEDFEAENLVRASGKFELLERILPRLWHFGHRVLLFAQTLGTLDLLERLLRKLGQDFERIDGKRGLRARREATSRFRADAGIGAFLLTTRAGGQGLNLQSADTVVLMDSDWNPQADVQAMDRAHRIGQTKPVLIIRLLTPTAVDRGLLDRASRKLDIERKVISAGRFLGEQDAAADEGGRQRSRESDLRRLVREARRAASGAGGRGDVTPLVEVSRLIARSGEEQTAFAADNLALLGPPAAGEDGAEEGAAARLERCSRLIAPGEVPQKLLRLSMRRVTEAPKARLMPRRKPRVA